jgi:hypothetical protein
MSFERSSIRETRQCVCLGECRKPIRLSAQDETDGREYDGGEDQHINVRQAV